MEQATIRTIVFDMGGILVGLDGQRCVRNIREVGCDEIAFYVEQHRVEDLFLEAERGEIGAAEFCDYVRRIVGKNVPDADIIRAWNSLLTGIPQEKVDTLLRLKAAGYRLLLLSNTNDMHWARCQELMAEHGHTMQELFEHCYLSNEMHKVKPNDDIFLQLLAESHSEAAETLFIDDSEANCATASRLGIHAFCDPKGTQWMDFVETRLLNFSSNTEP